MKINTFSLLAITSFVAINAGVSLPANADTLTTVTTTTTEAPASSYHYRRVIAPISVSSYQKNVTVQRSAVIKKSTCSTSCSTHHVSSIRHARYIASTRRPKLIASTSTTKTISRTYEKPVYVDRVVERPVYRDRVIEKPVVIERPVVVKQSYVEAVPVAPLYTKEKIEHHSDHDTIKIKQYY